jgi:hypothetical protein
MGGRWAPVFFECRLPLKTLSPPSPRLRNPPGGVRNTLIRLGPLKKGLPRRSLPSKMASPLPQLDERYTAPSLSFTLNSPTTNTLARSGELFFHPHSPADSPQPPTPTRVIPTPTVIAYARRGALPHLTRDNVARLPNEMVHLSLEHL